MKPTLNSADLKLLKGLFATKKDLVSMEKRQDSKYATKGDLVSMEKRQDQKYASKNDLAAMEKRIENRIDDLEERVVKYTVGTDSRLGTIEDELGIPHPN